MRSLLERARAVAQRLQDERGIALVMALGIMLVISLTLASVIQYTSANARSANRQNADQKAYALAEAALNNALAQLAANYPHFGDPPEDPSWAAAPTPVQYDTGTATWSGTYDPATMKWTLLGIGTVKNPTGPGAADVVRIATARIGVSAQPPEYTMYGLFAGDPSATCTDMGGSTVITVAVYVASTCGLTIRGGAGIVEPTPLSGGVPTVKVNVGGLLSVTGSGDKVGNASQPVLDVRTRTGCNLSASCQPGSTSLVYAQTYGTHVRIAMGKTTADEVYAQANWSSSGTNPVTCATGSNPFDSNSTRDHSLATVTDLLTRASFDCTARNATSGATVGRLAWNLSTKQMTIDGFVFIDGDLTTDPNNRMQYSGNGTIFVNGTVWHKGTICGPGSGFNAGATGSTPPCDPKQWDPVNGGLLIFALNANGPLVNNPVLTYLDPTADGMERNWTKTPSGSEAWQVLDDGVRTPAVPASDMISAEVSNSLQDVSFPNTLTHVSGTTYTLRVYGAGGNKRAVETLISTNDSTFGSVAVTIPEGAAASWHLRDVTSLITSQAALDGFRVRFQIKSSGGSGATAAQVHAVYLEAAVPNWTRELGQIATCPAPPNPYCSYWVNSGAVLEAGSWAIGNFLSDGGTHVGGSVYVDKGYATILGSGNLKAFVNLPPGAPQPLEYRLDSSAGDFG